MSVRSRKKNRKRKLADRIGRIQSSERVVEVSSHDYLRALQGHLASCALELQNSGANLRDFVALTIDSTSADMMDQLATIYPKVATQVLDYHESMPSGDNAAAVIWWPKDEALKYIEQLDEPYARSILEMELPPFYVYVLVFRKNRLTAAMAQVPALVMQLPWERVPRSPNPN